MTNNINTVNASGMLATSPKFISYTLADRAAFDPKDIQVAKIEWLAALSGTNQGQPNYLKLFGLVFDRAAVKFASRLLFVRHAYASTKDVSDRLHELAKHLLSYGSGIALQQLHNTLNAIYSPALTPKNVWDGVEMKTLAPSCMLSQINTTVIEHPVVGRYDAVWFSLSEYEVNLESVAQSLDELEHVYFMKKHPEMGMLAIKDIVLTQLRISKGDGYESYIRGETKTNDAVDSIPQSVYFICNPLGAINVILASDFVEACKLSGMIAANLTDSGIIRKECAANIFAYGNYLETNCTGWEKHGVVNNTNVSLTDPVSEYRQKQLLRFGDNTTLLNMWVDAVVKTGAGTKKHV